MFTARRTVVFLFAIGAIAGEPKAKRTDCYGDPLPAGAIARIGTVRGRLPGLVKACVFSHDSKILVAAGGDRAIHLFDAETLRPLRQLQGHKADVSCLTFSPDGKILASGGKVGDLCLWDWHSGKMLRQFPAHEEGVRALAFAGTGAFLASGGEDTRVRLWDPATGRELRQYKGHERPVTALAVSPDGRLVASCDQSFADAVQFWGAKNGQLLHKIKTGVHLIHSLVFSPDSKLVAFPVDFLKIGLWDVASGKMVSRLSEELSGWIAAVAFSPDGQIVAAAATDGRLVLWEMATGKVLHQRPGNNYFRQPGGVSSLIFSPDGRRLVMGEDQCLRVWDVGAWREVQPVDGHANRLFRVLFSRDDKTLVTAANDVADALREWDVATGKHLRTLWRQRTLGGHGFHLSPDHREVTVAETEENGLVLYSRNTTTGKDIRRVALSFDRRRGYSPARIVFSPDGKMITSESREKDGLPGPALVRDTASGKVIGKLPSDYDFFRFSPDSSYLACIKSKQVDLYNMLRGRITWERPFRNTGFCVQSLAFSPDNRLVAVFTALSRDYSRRSSDEPNRFRLFLWETTTGQTRADWEASLALFVSSAISPDGSLLAAGDSKGVIHLWSLATGKQIRELKGHRRRIESLAFSHDGKLLASGGSDTTALIWDIRDAAEAARPHPSDMPSERLERLWADLAGNDGDCVHQAIWSLVAVRQVVPWLRERLKPVPQGDGERIARLIADLDSDSFDVREKATHELEKMGESAEPALRKVLAGKPTLELRRRVEPIVKQLEELPASSPAALRAWRALEVLEHLGSPEARQLLQKLAEGTPEARLTHEAKAALQRLGGRRQD